MNYGRQLVRMGKVPGPRSGGREDIALAIVTSLALGWRRTCDMLNVMGATECGRKTLTGMLLTERPAHAPRGTGHHELDGS